MGHNNVIGVWDGASGKRIRIAFGTNENNLKGIMWVQVSKDGSIYLGPRNPDYKHQKYGSIESKDGEVFVAYDDGKPIEDLEALSNPKLSFHSSGTVHAAGERSFRAAFRELNSRELICQVLSQDPSDFPLLGKAKKFDIGLNYPVDKNRPIICNIYVYPIAEEFSPIEVKGAMYQSSVVLRYSCLEGVPDMTVQLVFFHSKEADWPPATYIIWKAEPDEK